MKRLISVLILITTATFACQFDTDCYPGAQCLKQGYQIYGVCVGGIQPGNANDQRPAQFVPDLNRTRGNTCQWDTDCGPGGSTCVKSGYSIYGTCM